MIWRWTLLGGMVCLIGCSDRPRTIVSAQAVDLGNQATSTNTFEFGSAPEKSDPAAVELVNQALAAHTDGRPEKLEPAKSVRMTMTGPMIGPSGQPLSTLVTLLAQWPDKARSTFEIQGLDAKTMTYIRDGSSVWQQMVSSSTPSALKQRVENNYEKTVINDSSAFWIYWLTPFRDPNAIVAPAAPLSVGDKKLPGIKLWIPGFPNAAAFFDPETHRMVRILYEDQEAGQRIVKRFDLNGDITAAGITYPRTIVYSASGRVIAEWEVTKIEFPSEIDAKQFAEP